MPWINGRFYANPLFGRALEHAREAESGRVWSEEYPELGFQSSAEQTPRHATPGQTPRSQPLTEAQPERHSNPDHSVTPDGHHTPIHSTRDHAKSRSLPTSGKASIYADSFEGKPTASTETFRQAGYTAALLPRVVGTIFLWARALS